jgi:hypothetical protein
MSSQAQIGETTDGKGGMVMSSHGDRLGTRVAVWGTALLLALALAGDRGRAASVPPTIYGQDPLEVLELKVRPNVIVVLDSSGSMTNVADEGSNTNSGDHPRSKMWQAKQVLKTVVQNNQDKVSFQLGTYTQYSISFGNQGRGANRFQYVVSGNDAPFMGTSTTELVVRGALNDTLGRGVQSWQIIHEEWSRLYFGEQGGVVCTATLPGPFPKFYARGGSGSFPATSTTPQNLAFDLQTAMNNASCTGTKANTYAVSYSAANGQFTFGATGTASFSLRPTDTPNNIDRALGGLPTTTGTPGSSGSSTTITLTGVTNLQRRFNHTRVYIPSNPGLSLGDTCTVSGSVMPSNPQANGTWSVINFNAGYFRLSGPAGTTASATTIGTITCTHATSGGSATVVESGSPYTLLYRATGTGNSGTGLNTRWTFTEEIGGVDTSFYQLRAGRLWNGEILRVTPTGETCGMDFATAATKTKPPSLTVQAASAACVPTGDSAKFVFGGGDFTGNNRGCRGFRSKSDLVPCDLQTPPAPTQITQILPYIEGELPFNDAGDPQDLTTNDATGAPGGANYGVPDGIPDYVEAQDGGWGVSYIAVAPSAKADGWTPIANSLIDIKGAASGANNCLTNAAPASGTYDPLNVAGTIGACTERGFSKLWNTGQTGSTAMAGPPPWQLDPISAHRDPKEKTIVLFVTDGDDTCGSVADGGGTSDLDGKARRAASYAEALYTPLDAAEPASSVQTYVIGYGGAFTAGEPYRLNWIAWGGSGLGQGTATQPNVNWTTDSSTTLANQRARCATCTDAFIAPDSATLATQLQGLIDQGASSGDFNAQQSVTDTVFEYVNRADPAVYDSRNPRKRYRALVPTLFTSSFSLPGFNGQLRAYQNDGAGNALLMWNAGEKLRALVADGMAACNTTVNGGAIAECSFALLHGGATDDTVATSSAAIKRRVYTNSRNGVYDFTAPNLIDASWVPPQRLTLWPPASGVTPNSFASQGNLDEAFGLPLDTSTTPAADFTALQGAFKACLGTNLPAACASASALTRMQAARREAREIMLAFMMGAEPVPAGSGLKRGTSGAIQNQILYKARSWVLADSELATVAIATPPLPAEPRVYAEEFELLVKGPRDGSGKNTDTAGLQLRQGFGLRSPDDDGTAGTGALEVDSRPALKPVMTVVYAPANDMLHAFRAGPCYGPSTTPSNCVGASTSESGGEELWGFVPFDMLHAVRLRAANQPQGRDNHVFMLARGMRLTDVFVPGAMTNVSIGGMTEPSMAGVWRRVIWFGRGIGGKYVTALDVTAVGAFTTTALSTRAPIPLWSRGNPDTQSGLASDGNLNGTTTDRDRYKKMGETWSVPVVGLVDSSNGLYNTPRRPAGVDFALFMGSGFGDTSGCGASTDPCEGRTFFTLDALSGDVIASKDVEEVAAANGLTRSGLAYPATLVANPAGFQPEIFQEFATVHPASAYLKRVYIGDTHGRVWKVLTAAPDVILPFADLGENQAVGTAVALNGLPPYNEATGETNPVPFVHVTSGNDTRAVGPFKIFGFRDDGADTAATTGGTVVANEVTSFTPAVSLFTQTFDPGDPEANCGYTAEALFRGTVQPATTYERVGSGPTQTLVGRVLYGGTRLSLPNTKFAPVTPLACGQGEYPCRSQFDSIIYALGTETGEAAYDLNANGDDAYRVFRDSRVVAISIQADPDPAGGGSRVNLDEGLVKTTPKPPPPPGVPPLGGGGATANVVFERVAGQPAPSVRYGSTVCQ